MAGKASRQESDLLNWLIDRGEEAVGRFVQEVVESPGFSDGVSRVIRGATQTKGKVDKNVETVLHLLNLPSRADYEKLLMKIEYLQGSLINLNMKLDRVLDAQAGAKTSPRRSSKPRRKSTVTKKATRKTPARAAKK